MNFRKMIFVVASTILAHACATRAPSNYELDRRSGMHPSDGEEPENELTKELGRFRSGGDPGKEALMPVRAPAVIEKVWIYDQKLGKNWMQGTWVFIEVDGEKWLPELEASGGGLIEERNSIELNRSYR